MTKFLALVAASSIALGCGSEADSENGRLSQTLGVTGPAFYVEGEIYRTVGTPTELDASQPDHSFDTIYDLGGLQLNVAEAGPGVEGFNGGRWEVHAIEFENYAQALADHDLNGSGTFDFASEIESALAAGDATDQGIVRRFVCPVIHVPSST